jgi:hypothetical protein
MGFNGTVAGGATDEFEHQGRRHRWYLCGQKEVEMLKEWTRWMAVMTLLSSKPFSDASFKKTIIFSWAPPQEMSFRDLEEKKFVIQANWQ